MSKRFRAVEWLTLLCFGGLLGAYDVKPLRAVLAFMTLAGLIELLELSTSLRPAERKDSLADAIGHFVGMVIGAAVMLFVFKLF